MSQPNEVCTSTTCTLAPLRIRHYRWQCGSDTLDQPARQPRPGLLDRAATAVHRTVRDALAKPDDSHHHSRRW